VIGYEFAKTTGLARKLRAYFEAHSGLSVEGQLARKKTDYVSLRISYGY
jgi:hypothetical protein